MNKRKRGYQAENIVKQYLIDNGYKILHQNYTIRGGELDIISEKDNNRVFIEVKEVEQTKDLHNYISTKKLQTIYKTIQFFNQEYPTNKQLRIDLVFVKQNLIIHHYENISNN
ncbi:MAG: YraN family protein [Candidatus Absconditabacteria bacterium]|nr:YraN family protein [Candidatus Absconditabacteria bacterium]